MFNRMKAVVTFAAGAVAGLMLAACLTVQGSRPGVFGGEALILPLMALLLYVGYEAGRLSTLAQAEHLRAALREAAEEYATGEVKVLCEDGWCIEKNDARIRAALLNMMKGVREDA